ncbi:MAG TPA: hypothetical protein VF538_12485 [Pyrinomonadaceae bacterium]|jgi:hypothetical protein
MKTTEPQQTPGAPPQIAQESETQAARFPKVFRTEWDEIRTRRHRCGVSDEGATSPPRDLVGLALSGGGNRSATFCLGLLQGLHAGGLLRVFDYLSTVSGGGYLGGWWSAWLARAPEAQRGGGRFFPPRELISPLAGEGELDSGEPAGSPRDGAKRRVKEEEVEDLKSAGRDPVKHLRLFANYLTPRKGALSADTWRAATVIGRNLTLTWSILLPILIACVLVGQLYFVLQPDSYNPQSQFFFFTYPATASTAAVRARLLLIAVPLVLLAGLMFFTTALWMKYSGDVENPREQMGGWFGAGTVFLLLSILGLIVYARATSASGAGVLGALPGWAKGRGLLGCWGLSVVLIVVYGLYPPVDFPPSWMRRCLNWMRRRFKWMRRLFKWMGRLFKRMRRLFKSRAGQLMTKEEARRERRWRREERRNKFIGIHSKLLVAFFLTAMILIFAGFGHELVNYMLARDTRLRGGLAAYAARSGGWLALALAIGGSIYTAVRTSPAGGHDRRDVAAPSRFSRVIFAVTPTLVLVVLAVLASWLANVLMTLINRRYVALDVMRGAAGAQPDARLTLFLSLTTCVGVALALYFALAETRWRDTRGAERVKGRIRKRAPRERATARARESRGAGAARGEFLAPGAEPPPTTGPGEARAGRGWPFKLLFVLWLGLASLLLKSLVNAGLALKGVAVAPRLARLIDWDVIDGLGPIARYLMIVVYACTIIIYLSWGDKNPLRPVRAGAGAEQKRRWPDSAGVLWLGFLGWAVKRFQQLPAQERLPTPHGFGDFLAAVPLFCLLYLLLEVGVGERDNNRPLALVQSALVVLTAFILFTLVQPGGGFYHTALLGQTVFAFVGVMLTWVVALGWLHDPNATSMHTFYKGRLVRAYLGASNPMRQTRYITEYARDDDVLLRELRNCERGAPYHLINTTLNLVGGRDLATAQRSSAYFTLSKHYCGSLPTGYRSTAHYLDGQLSLGTAVAVSGAAASPNMGAMTLSSSLAMLMTFLNVRLGFWAPTPNKRDWREPYARLWPFYILRELLSQTNALSNYCYLTDGGHFDNTGLYSLVQRGCRYVVVADCGADPAPCFQDLGDALRRCRIDFGAEIRLNIAALEKNSRGLSEQPFVVGTILYSEDHAVTLGWTDTSRGARTGVVVWFKPSLSKDKREAADVRQYRMQNGQFPQQSTADFWYDEAQFESYRRLGENCAERFIESLGDALTPGAERPLDRDDVTNIFGRVLANFSVSHDPGAAEAAVAAETSHLLPGSRPEKDAGDQTRV